MRSQFQVFKDNKGEWRWHLRAENNESIAASSEGYVAKADALNGVDIVKRMDGNVTVYQDARGEWRWRLVHANGKIIATAGESYVAKLDCEHGLSVVKKLGPEAPIHELA